MPSIEDIYDFISHKTGLTKKNLDPKTDIYRESGLWGEACFELECSFAKIFHVNMESFRWYFHHGEEGFSPGRLFFKAPQDCVERIPITPTLLLDSANNNQWMLEYPDHTVPDKRRDLEFNAFLIYGALPAVLMLVSIVLVIIKICT